MKRGKSCDSKLRSGESSKEFTAQKTPHINCRKIIAVKEYDPKIMLRKIRDLRSFSSKRLIIRR